jgi:hypothetical protein
VIEVTPAGIAQVPVPAVKITMQLLPDWVAVAVAPVTVETQLPEPMACAVGAEKNEKHEATRAKIATRPAPALHMTLV